MRRLVAFQNEVELAYTSIVSLSVGPPEVAVAFRAGLGAPWTFLADPDRQHLDVLDLRETTDTVHHPYRPAVFVLAPNLTVHSAYTGHWYWGRPGLEELRADLRAVTRAIRTDWEVPR